MPPQYSKLNSKVKDGTVAYIQSVGSHNTYTYIECFSFFLCVCVPVSCTGSRSDISDIEQTHYAFLERYNGTKQNDRGNVDIHSIGKRDRSTNGKQQPRGQRWSIPVEVRHITDPTAFAELLDDLVAAFDGDRRFVLRISLSTDYPRSIRSWVDRCCRPSGSSTRDAPGSWRPSPTWVRVCTRGSVRGSSWWSSHCAATTPGSSTRS